MKKENEMLKREIVPKVTKDSYGEFLRKNLEGSSGGEEAGVKRFFY
jgi:hypothetical protein